MKLLPKQIQRHRCEDHVDPGGEGENGVSWEIGTDMNTLLCAVVLDHFSWVALQAPLSMRFSRQECWSGLPCPPPGHLPHPESEPASLMPPAFQVGSLPLALPGNLENLLYSTGSSTQCSVVTKWEGNQKKRGNISVHTADSLCCTAEMNTTL